MTDSSSKTCNKCEELKPLTDFHKLKTVKDGRKGDCADCCNAASRKWRQDNPAAAKASVDDWRERNAEAYLEYKRGADREYRLNNLDRIKARRASQADEVAASLAVWKSANRERVRDYERKRRAAVRGSRVGDIDFAAVWDKSGGECVLCGAGMDRSLSWPDRFSVSLDHITPLAKQGPHITENVQYVHLVCNMRKNDRVPA